MTIPWRTILALAAVTLAVLVLLSVGGHPEILLAVAIVLIAASVLA